jgi:protein-disulfide isomerase
VIDAETLAERRRRRVWLLGASAACGAVLVAIAIAFTSADEETAGTTTGPPEGVAETLGLFRGIPQRGPELGRRDAPVTLVEFADLQGPFCGEYSREAVPEVVSRYVRPGRVKVRFVNWAFLGEDSTEAARMAAAAGRQGKLFQFVDLVYRNQGSENTGWVTTEYLARIGRAVRLDVPRALRDAGSPAAAAEVKAAAAEAKRAGVNGTPTVLIFRAGSAEPRRLEAGEVSAGEVTEALDEALAGR